MSLLATEKITSSAEWKHLVRVRILVRVKVRVRVRVSSRHP